MAVDAEESTRYMIKSWLQEGSCHWLVIARKLLHYPGHI